MNYHFKEKYKIINLWNPIKVLNKIIVGIKTF